MIGGCIEESVGTRVTGCVCVCVRVCGAWSPPLPRKSFFFFFSTRLWYLAFFRDFSPMSISLSKCAYNIEHKSNKRWTNFAPNPAKLVVFLFKLKPVVVVSLVSLPSPLKTISHPIGTYPRKWDHLQAPCGLLNILYSLCVNIYLYERNSCPTKVLWVWKCCQVGGREFPFSK